MKMPNWGTIFLSVINKVTADIKANKTLPAPAPMSSADIATALTQLQAELPAIIAALNAHPGMIRAADDVLEALDAQGYLWASQAETAVNAAPGALSAAAGWLPEVLWALGAFQPAATGIVGDRP